MFVPQQSDIDILDQHTPELFIKLFLLNNKFQTIDELEGTLISGSITLDADSDIRRTASFNFYIEDMELYAEQYSKIWMDKFVDLRLGIKNQSTNQMQWYPLGIFLFNENGFRYDLTTKFIECSCVDLMALYTGLRAGTLPGLRTIATYGLNVTDIVRDTIIQLGNIQNFIINENTNPGYLTIPYELEFGTGVTVYEILKKISDIYPATEFFFDIDRTFIWSYMPTATDDPVVLDNDIIAPLVDDENANKDFSKVKNCIEVWGQDDISARIILVDELPKSSFIYGTNLVGEVENNSDLPKNNTEFIIAFGVNPNINDAVRVISDETMGDRCIEWYVTYIDEDNNISWGMPYFYFINPDSPFTIDKLGEIWGVFHSGEYSMIYSNELCLDRCLYELYIATSMQDRLSLSMILIPFLQPNQKISYKLKSIGETNQYIVKRINFDLTSYRMQVELMKFTPLYSWL